MYQQGQSQSQSQNQGQGQGQGQKHEQEDRSDYFERLMKSTSLDKFESELKEIVYHNDSFIDNCDVGKNAKIVLQRLHDMWQTYQQEPALTIVCKNKKGNNDLNAYLNWVDRRNINQGIGLLLITPDTLTQPSRQYVWHKGEMAHVRGIETGVRNRDERRF
jgi:hypothetical protein